MPVSMTTGLPTTQRYRPLTQATTPKPVSDVPPMASDVPPGGYNNPANAPTPMVPDGAPAPLPPKPAPRTPFGVGKGFENHQQIPDYQDPTGHAPIQPQVNHSPTNPITPPIVKPPVTPTPTVQPIAPTTSPVGSGLRGDTYLPGDDPRLTGAMGATDRAGAAVQGYDRNAMQTGNENRYRSIYGTGQVTADPSLTGAPDRTALAMQKLKDFDAQSAEQQFNDNRALGQNIAKFGRSGMQTNAGDFGEIQRKIEGDRARLKNELASSVAEGDINDRFKKLDFTTGLSERNADRAYQRTNAAIDKATGQTNASVGDTYDRFNAAGDLESRVFGQGQQNRNEYRTERTREDQQAQNTIENRLKEFEIQRQLEEAKLRNAALLAQAGGLG